jgi:hypothetical protein
MPCQHRDDLLDGAPARLEIGFFGIPGHVWTQNNVVQGKVIVRDIEFILKYIDADPGNLTADERLAQRDTVDQTASAHVDQDRFAFHSVRSPYRK